MKLLEVENLVTELGEGESWLRAVNNISLAVESGQTYCLVGESGSGKSVTALSIMGLLPQDHFRHPAGKIRLSDPQGELADVELLNADTETLRKVRGSRIAMIFQEPMTSLNPVQTIGEQLDEVLQIHQPELSEEARKQRVLAALEEVRIPEPASRIREFPHRLSGGQRQRVMIAMALICEPALLIADEPTTALDVTVQAEILKLMRELQTKRGMGMLFITHDFGVVAQIADVVGVMRKGILVESGTTAEVLRNPQHEYTQSLIAALPERLPRPARPAKSDKVLLEVKDVSVYFPVRRGLMRRVVDQFRAVDNVSLQVNAGEIVALVGESGCGKTTLGRALLRLQDVTAGSIILEGQDITQISAKAMRPLRRRMQVVFQDPGSSLNPRLPIHTTLIEPMRVHGIGQTDAERIQIAARFLDRVEMPTDSLWRYPHEFSGGQRQRLAIARALVLEPRFILCDEITSALDVSVQAGILKLLRQLVDEEGIGMLFITHNMGVVDYLADRMVVMHKAQLVESGITQQVMKSPQNAHTRNLLDAVPRLDDKYLASAI
ncbi:ABC transporter ATP-binding protein [Methylophaga muralis]|uniref:ABC-type dipeptide transporter n=1 Tax=Methylophaga muralis TaxID=291169 RepID=A0A1E3GUE9_9GAMM|nr:dipeptide ABC transporter ATP-binding protein [Methylophaga muralis]ODN67624.1 Glutathione import ATP-binding protein GsiA [Methylophaga muralis]